MAVKNISTILNETSFLEGKGGDEDENEDKNKEKNKEKKKKIPYSAKNRIYSYDKDGYSTNNSKLYKAVFKKSGATCLAGALNCTSQSSENEEFGFVNKDLPNYPSHRSLLTDTEKYRTVDTKNEEGEYVKNNSIDAWEYRNAMLKSGKAYDPFKETKFTYKKNNIIPDQILKKAKSLPIGTILGQGKVKTKYGYSFYDEQNPKNADANRHAVMITGYDDKDGMPIVFDSGDERRLDDLQYKWIGKVDNVTIPNEYKNLTYDNIKSNTKKRQEYLGYSNDDKDKVSLNSTWKPIQYIEKGVNIYKNKIGKELNVPKRVMDSFAKVLPGISHSESNLNNYDTDRHDLKTDTWIKDANSTLEVTLSDNWLMDKYKASAKFGIEMFEEFKDLTNINNKERKSVFKAEIEALEKGYKKGSKKFNNYVNKTIENNKNAKNEFAGEKIFDSSVGAFRIKHLPKLAEKLGISKSDLYGTTISNEEEFIKGSGAALSYLATNYVKFKEQYPDLSEKALIDLAIVSFNSGEKPSNDKFIKYYIKEKKLKDNYLEKVKNYYWNRKRDYKQK